MFIVFQLDTYPEGLLGIRISLLPSSRLQACFPPSVSQCKKFLSYTLHYGSHHIDVQEGTADSPRGCTLMCRHVCCISVSMHATLVNLLDLHAKIFSVLSSPLSAYQSLGENRIAISASSYEHTAPISLLPLPCTLAALSNDITA